MRIEFPDDSAGAVSIAAHKMGYRKGLPCNLGSLVLS